MTVAILDVRELHRIDKAATRRNHCEVLERRSMEWMVLRLAGICCVSN